MFKDASLDGMQVLMPATLPPRAPAQRAREALGAPSAGWRRRLRLSLEAQRLHDLRLHQHGLPLLSPNQIHLIRMDGRLIRPWPTPRWEWVRAGREGAGHPQRIGPLGQLEPLQLPAFELPPRFHNAPTPPNLHFTHLDLMQAAAAAGPRAGTGSAGSTTGTSAGASASASAGASGAVGAGAAVLALAALVLLARALERCLDRRLFKLLRRRSDEWFTPNVLTTSNHVSDDTVESIGPECSNMPPGEPPPPYSMCLPKSPRAPGGAEPPPPYSACYVAFSSLQDPQPRVHLNAPTLNSFQDTGQTVGTSGAQATHGSAEPETAGTRESGGAASRDPESDREPTERRNRANEAISETNAALNSNSNILVA